MPQAPAPGAPPRLVLASASPQRREILSRSAIAFSIRAANLDEREQGEPEPVALHNARAKATAIAAADAPDIPVLGVDTVVALDGRLFGKPDGERAARASIAALAGRTHAVVSAIALVAPDGSQRTATVVTEVSFRPLTAGEIDWYVGTGEWRGRAGGYAIQGAGAALVAAIRGDYLNVVGLPLAALLELAPDVVRLGGS